MALKVYQNQLRMDLIIPGWESTFHLYPGEYVGGEYYTRFAPTLLTDVTDQNIPVEDIKYIYPGSTDGPSGGGAIDAINGVAPIQTSTLEGVTTISLDTLTGSLFGPGEVVKSINGIADVITITNGAGISIDTGVDNITITNTQLGLTDTYATPPLYLTLGEGNVSLEGSIAITPTDDGGAVALQTGTPVYQTGLAALNSVYLKSAEDVDPFFRVYSSNDTLYTSIDKEGILYTKGFVTENNDSIKTRLYSSIVYDGTTYTTGDLLLYLDGSGQDTSYVNLPFEIRSLLTLEQSELNPANFGSIIGTQKVSYTDPFISLYTIPDQTTPLIKLTGGYTSGTSNNNVYLNIVDDQDASLISLHGDGIITAKTLDVDTVNTTTINAETINTNSTFIAGPATLNVTTSGPNTIMADCSAGAVVVQLPDLNEFTRSLTVTVIKVDNTNNDVSLVNGLNSTINGSTLAVNLTNQYETITIVSNGIKWFKIGAM